MMNRWQGNSGRVQRLPEAGDKSRPQSAPKAQEAPQPQPKRNQSPPPRRAPALPPLFASPLGSRQGGLFSSLEGLKKLIPGKAEELETEDIILLLILYLMYRESGDSELLMIMGAMFLL